MRPQIPEADWKAFRQLHELALERFSQAVRTQCIAKFGDTALSEHERYLAVYELIQSRNSEMARLFDSPRRSMAIIHLRGFWEHGLIGEQDVQGLSEETRKLAGLRDET